MLSLSPELRLLLLACRAHRDEAAHGPLRALIERAAINWDEVRELAAYHRVRPLLFRALKPLASTAVPPAFLEELRVACQAITLFNLDNARESLRVIRVLAAAGLTAIPYRGLYMATKVYGDPGLRETTDIDLFIRLEELPRLTEALRPAGYAPHHAFTPAAARAYLRWECEYKYDRKDGDTLLFHLEAHWMPAARRYAMPVRLPDVEGQLIPSEIGGVPVQAFSPEMLLLQLTMHHGGIDQWRYLKFACDVAFLLDACRSAFDWELALAEARRLGILGLTLNGVALADALFDLPLPAPVRRLTLQPRYQRLAAKQIRRLERPHLVGNWSPTRVFFSVLAYHLAVRERWSDRRTVLLLNLRQLLLPNVEEINASGLPFPWYYALLLVKPLRLLWKHGVRPVMSRGL